MWYDSINNLDAEVFAVGVIITVAIEKGGVGKTATVTNLAAVYAKQGKRVLVVDMDTQCNSTYFLTGNKKRQNKYRTCGVAELLRVYDQGVDYSRYIKETQIPNLYIIPSNAATSTIPTILQALNNDYDSGENTFLALSLNALLEKNPFDYVIIDTPPNMELQTTNALVACDYLLIPFNCEEQALDGLQDTDQLRKRLEQSEDAKIDLLGIVMTMVERASLTKEMRTQIEESEYGKYLFKTEIRKGQAVKDSGTYGKPVVITSPSSNPAKDYVTLAAEIEKRILDREANRQWR